jgi:hypothetical protein
VTVARDRLNSTILDTVFTLTKTPLLVVDAA